MITKKKPNNLKLFQYIIGLLFRLPMPDVQPGPEFFSGSNVNIFSLLFSHLALNAIIQAVKFLSQKPQYVEKNTMPKNEDLDVFCYCYCMAPFGWSFQVIPDFTEQTCN